MITKGIILERVVNSNIYKVRIPYLEKAGFNAEETHEAILCHEPGVIESYLPGDVVLIGFEDHNANQPIILGKLYLQENASRGYGNFESLNVSSSANLPQNTCIGDIDVYKTLLKLNRLANNVSDASVNTNQILIVDLSDIN